MTRVFDIFIASVGLLVFSPLILVVIFFIWKQDNKNPFYIANRTGKKEQEFKLIKLRSMIVDADKSNIDSTSVNDHRITSIGKFIRKYKLDEITQLWNVLLGHMSLVGPRPNVKSETDLYSPIEKGLLTVKPGITDFSSIIFSDEGEILKNEKDPDLSYNQLIRPWKSRLGLIYIENRTPWLDIQLIFFTVISIFSKKIAINWVVKKLEYFKVDALLIKVARRKEKLFPHPPPGMNEIVISR